MTIPDHTPLLLNSTDHGLPLRTRTDLIVTEIPFDGQPTYVVKDPLSLRYHRLQPVQHFLLSLMAEGRTFDELQERLNEFEPAAYFEMRDVQRMLVDLHEKGLLVSQRPGQGTQLWQMRQKERRREWWQSCKSFLFLRFPGWSPERMLDGLEPVRRLLLHPLSLALQTMVIFASLLLVVREQAEFQSRLPGFQQFFQAGNLPYLWLSVILAKMVHEMGHALVCRHLGAVPHQIGVMLLVFTPTMYCDVSDSWMLKNKWKRIAIGLGGPFFEAVLASIALFVWWWTVPGLIHFVCLNLFLVSAVTAVLFNLNPLIRFDGYYVLSDYLEIPNLKQQSDRAMQAAFCRHVLGVELPRDPLVPESNNPWLIVYGIAAWCYRWLIMLAITMFLYSVLKPWGMARFAFVLVAITVGTMFYSMGRSMKQALQQIAPVQPSRFRYGLISLCGIGAVIALFLVPIPYWIVCSFELEPRDSRHIHAVTPGFLEEIRAQPGETVEAGEVILKLNNPDLTSQRLELEKKWSLLEKQLLVARLQRKSDQIAVAMEQLNSLTAQFRNLQEQIDRLEVVAPISGRLFPAESKPFTLANEQDRLPQWHGTIFDDENRAAWLPKGAPLFTIAPSDGMQAVLLINQDDVTDVSTGQAVQLQCEPWSGTYLDGTIADLAEQETQVAPTVLSEKAGGDLATTGSARVIISHRSAAEWAWRLARQTFEFRL